MPLERCRIYLTILFGASFVLQATLLWICVLKGLIYVPDFTTLLMSVFAVYSAHIGIIVGALFGPTNETRSRSFFWLAFGMASVWIAILAARTGYFTFAANDTMSSLSGDLVKYGGMSSVLVGGAMSYVFNKKEAKSGD